MKRFILVAAAVVLAGSAAAQSQSQPQYQQQRPSVGPVYGVQRPLDDDSSPIVVPTLGSIKDSAALRSAKADFRQACEADRQALCKDRAAPEASTRCILRQRSKLSSSCGQALTTLADLENIPLGRP